MPAAFGQPDLWSVAMPESAMGVPARWPVAPDWQPVVNGFWASSAGRGLAERLHAEAASGRTWFPAEPLRALRLTPRSAVRVVILGQDPYHGPGQAEGLAFSVPAGQKVPPSLRNIHQELVRDLGGTAPMHGSLLAWARQGVLLLNTALTVRAGEPGSHAGWGWQALTDAVIDACSRDDRPKAFLLWGAHAQSKRGLVDAGRHLVLEANHPSPLSARRGPVPFIGCGHFGRLQRWWLERGEQPVDWFAPPDFSMA